MNGDSLRADRAALDGLTALGLALRGGEGASSVENVCFELGGEGARRACAVLRDLGVRVHDERGDSAVSAALGAAAAGARVVLLASGAWTTALARATREASRVGVIVTGVVLSHGDDIGAVLPAADGADLAALGAADAERWTLSTASEVRAWLAQRGRALDAHTARSAVAVMDLRSVAMRLATVIDEPNAELAPVAHDGRLECEVVLISCGSGAQARAAAEWLRREGIAASSAQVRRFETDEDRAALRGALRAASKVVVHELGCGFSGPSAIECAALEGGAEVLALSRAMHGAAADAADFCAFLAQARHRRAALAAGSHALRVQLVGPPSSRAHAVELAIDALARGGMLAWAERVEPTHAMLTIDVGAARSVGSSGWLVVVPGLPVRAPIEPALGATSMVVDAGEHSSLLSSTDVSARDQASLVLAVAVVELELRGQASALLALQAALSDGEIAADPMAWGEVRARADHLRSLR
ncbi:MAG: hypothetical protein U0269_33470 [Polyangiales bacterium]